MATPGQAIFEAPAAHEAHYSNPEAEWETHETHYSNPYSMPEAEWEEEAHYSSPEAEWEVHETPYSNPYSMPEAEWEEEVHYSTPEAEWETHEVHYSNPYSNPEAEWELEDEADRFFGKALRAIKSVASRVAPMAARALGGMIPGVGAIAGPLLGQLTSSLLREGEMEAANLEAELFGHNEAEAEVTATEAGHEAALTELFAAEASEAETEAEAEAVLAAALPITITIMGGRRALRPVLPTLAQANGRLVRVLRRHGPAGRQLLRTVPAIQRRTVGTLRAIARSGRPITGPLAVRTMAAAARGVLADPRQVQRAITRNAVLRRRVAPPNPRRAAVFVPSRVTPPHPRRAAGYQPMRATARQVPL